MNKFILLISVLVLLIVGSFFYFRNADVSVNTGEIMIKITYNSSSGEIKKIIYQISEETTLSDSAKHCARLGGVFNENGNICEPGATACVEVIAVTCEIP